MVLFEFDKVIKQKYLKYLKLHPEKISDISFDEFYWIGIDVIKKKFPSYFSNISLEYVDRVLINKSNKILFSCLDSDEFNLKNVSSILIYHKIKINISQTFKQTKYYILLLGTHEDFRKFGYGKVMLDEFVEFIKLKKSPNIIILLKSLESSLNFYIDYGFVKTELEPNRLFYKYENTNELKNSLENILELKLN